MENRARQLQMKGYQNHQYGRWLVSLGSWGFLILTSYWCCDHMLSRHSFLVLSLPTSAQPVSPYLGTLNNTLPFQLFLCTCMCIKISKLIQIELLLFFSIKFIFEDHSDFCGRSKEIIFELKHELNLTYYIKTRD